MAEATPPAPASLLEVATDAAAEAASMVLARAGASFALETKASDIDLVTEVDHASERLLIERLLDARPDDGILGEEGGSIVGTSGVPARSDWRGMWIDGRKFVCKIACSASDSRSRDLPKVHGAERWYLAKI